MERVPVDTDDRPEQEIKITGAQVFVNPYKEMEEEERKKADAERRKVCQEENCQQDVQVPGVIDCCCTVCLHCACLTM